MWLAAGKSRHPMWPHHALQQLLPSGPAGFGCPCWADCPGGGLLVSAPVRAQSRWSVSPRLPLQTPPAAPVLVPRPGGPGPCHSPHPHCPGQQLVAGEVTDAETAEGWRTSSYRGGAVQVLVTTSPSMSQAVLPALHDPQHGHGHQAISGAVSTVPRDHTELLHEWDGLHGRERRAAPW